MPLGDNLYNKDRPKVVPPPRGADTHNGKQQLQQAEHHDPNPVAGGGQSGRVSRRCAMLPDDLPCPTVILATISIDKEIPHMAQPDAPRVTAPVLPRAV